ncbi:class I SAM-dependent methyltransferase [Aeromicrobium sp. YIM 150415]|uniref:SAM-dependent methyltransferase n=1 Tax=Aeromicrobium sp. YIM 150415 TaxID=2803912 RepID=UPI001963FE13|nr:cyclopropane-fatty-acyl-phospholipid synthase family protein [Aeromicrobium sp. YIM 150415]MBM9462185.1 class I SAM-dependent methyltransferase [Aeromicrobium sp. YIM 150415]
MSSASRVYRLLSDALGFEVPLRIRLWNGQEHGPADAPLVVLRSRRAVRHLLYRPGELGAARAYVTGELDVEGMELADALRHVWSAVDEARARDPRAARLRVRPGTVARAAVLALRLGAIGPRPAPPAAESALTGEVHSAERDRAAISHHYDISNEFYRLLMDETMAYSCAYFSAEGMTLAEAQRAKLDLVCRKLGLRPGMRLLDIGCGWGSLTLHAAEHYGVTVTGVTLSSEQRDHVTAVAAERGVGDRVDVSLRHYRDLALEAGSVDAVSSIEMGEHVGDEEYVDFAGAIHRYLRPRGRALVQQMSRSGEHPGGGPFIETYIAPDMHMKPLHRTLELFAGAGLEIRDVQALREHYPRTVAFWADNLERRWHQAVDLLGEETARVWRLYLAGGALAFEQNRMGVDQLLLVKPAGDGSSGMPATPLDWLT